MPIPVATLLVNHSFEESTFLDGGKTAIVKPNLKKPNLDLLSLKSWRPISNISFESKIEGVVIERFNCPSSTHNLLTSQHTGGVDRLKRLSQ
jgi:hypothetical protein